MARRKAKLDLYEVLEGGVETKTSPSEVSVPLKKKLWNPYVLLTFVVLFLVVAGLSWWSFEHPKEGVPESVVDTGKPDFSFSKMDQFNVDDLLVYVREGKGKQCILLCSFVLEVEEGKKEVVLGRQEDIRKVMYRTLDEEEKKWLFSSLDRKALKKRLKDNVNALIGVSCVRDVYITKFLMIS